jgi:NAD-specific glutamate dehydrogenase
MEHQDSSDQEHQISIRFLIFSSRYIVEGANLFFTQEARLCLEKASYHFFSAKSTFDNYVY